MHGLLSAVTQIILTAALWLYGYWLSVISVHILHYLVKVTDMKLTGYTFYDNSSACMYPSFWCTHSV